ncbi:MAG: histidine phosphatase family protein, partial [Pseudomonadales bacterium]|nr:histidine phosphatase family protein [Pseudomonadales bacterium]
QTAALINEHLNLPVTYDDRLKEWDCGDWSGHLYAEVAERWKEEWAAYQADRFHYRGPNCENYPDMFARARPFVEELLDHPAQRVAVVSHGMIGKVLMAILLDLGEAETLAIHQPNDVIMVLRGDAPAFDAHHYRGSDGPFDGLHVQGEQTSV